ncbi:hypothetical protein [Clostridium hydrogeniformans]|uniref:hypothetical protein n=1 Tax=Clostridium hydrogeniformans TaxID=349933 RepID=UPI0004863105|nr:hypothetical protein [Clostridium hydrogeniformans]
MVTGVCPTCGREFTKNYKATYCSKKCAKNTPKFRATRICPICNKEFITKYPSTKFCSEDCKRLNTNAQQRERTKIKYKKTSTLEEFWNKEAPILGKGEALRKLENKFKMSPEKAEIDYECWRNRYRGVLVVVKKVIICIY